MDFIDDYITTEYNIFLAELKSEKKKQGQSVLGTVGGVKQTVTTTLATPPEELPSRPLKEVKTKKPRRPRTKKKTAKPRRIMPREDY